MFASCAMCEQQLDETHGMSCHVLHYPGQEMLSDRPPFQHGDVACEALVQFKKRFSGCVRLCVACSIVLAKSLHFPRPCFPP